MLHHRIVHQNAVSNDVLAYAIPTGTISATIQHPTWSTGGYVDVYGVTSGNVAIYLNRIDAYNGASQSWHGNLFDGVRISVAASNLDAFVRLEIRCRKGKYHHLSIGFHSSILPCNATPYVHSDNVYGYPGSLSDARLKTERTDVTGAQALSVLGYIHGCTYNREDLNNERRLGLIADEVETAIAGLSIDNVVGSKLVGEEQYKTLD